MGKVDARFNVTRKNAVSDADTIRSTIETAMTELGTALDDYQIKTDAALSAMGTSYDTFIKDSLDEAKTATDELNESNEEFVSTLNELIGEITDCTIEITY
jgi:hypothetical protein